MVGFLALAQFKNSLTTIDLQTNSWAVSIQNGSFTTVAIWISYGFDTTSLIAVAFVIAIFLFLKKHVGYAVLLLASMGGDALVVSITKTLIQSPRPPNGLVYDAEFGFPSGHTAAGVVLCGLLTYFAWQHWMSSTKTKAVSAALFVTVTSVVAFDRIYLNVHWFSDVAGGYLLGFFWLTFSLLVFGYVKGKMRLHETRSRHSTQSSPLISQVRLRLRIPDGSDYFSFFAG